MKVTAALVLVLVAAFADRSTGQVVVEKSPEQVQSNNRWVNGYDQPLNFECPRQQSISMIISIHDNGREDRMWDFSCKSTFTRTSSCYWSEYVNDFDQQFSFTCPFGSVLTGMQSYHDNKKEDRRWKFLCCAGDVSVSVDCKWSGYVNNFDEYLRWDAPQNYFLVGASSYHDNSKEDRRWNYRYCRK